MSEFVRVLILGGTSEAIALAKQALTLPNVTVITSLAGRTRSPIAPEGDVRMGGFGGEAGLIEYLQEQGIDIVIDATHPFAAQISMNAAAATSALRLPHLMVIRPAWEKQVSDRWIEVSSNVEAAEVLPELARRVFLTIGRQELSTFASLTDHWFLMRMIDPPQPPIPPGQVILERGPFSLEQERSLLQDYQIGAIVSKNSGGNATYAKIIAARELGLPVVMVRRPRIPEGQAVGDVAGAMQWLQQAIAMSISSPSQ